MQQLHLDINNAGKATSVDFVVDTDTATGTANGYKLSKMTKMGDSLSGIYHVGWGIADRKLTFRLQGNTIVCNVEYASGGSKGLVDQAHCTSFAISETDAKNVHAFISSLSLATA